MRRRMLALVAATALLAVPVYAAAQTDTPSPTGTEEKVTFIYGDTGEPSSLNPMKGYLAIDFYFWNWSYHLPISFGVEDLGAVPDFVTDVQVSEDGTTFTYETRSGLRWSDGEPMTAEDLA